MMQESDYANTFMQVGQEKWYKQIKKIWLAN